MTRHYYQSAGFTLIEVLVASVIVSLLLATLAQSLAVAFRARRAATDGLDTLRSARLALDMLARDLQTAQPPTGIFAHAFTTSATMNNPNGTSDGLTFFNLADPTRGVNGAGDMQQVTFALVAATELQLTPPAQPPMLNDQVTGNDIGPTLPNSAASARSGGGSPRRDAMGFEGDSGGDPGGVLVRRVNRTLLAPLLETPVDQVLCRNVRSLSFQVYDGTQWVNAWDAGTQNNALPVAVQITLEITDGKGLGLEAGRLGRTATSTPQSSYILTRVVRLPYAASTNAGLGGTP